MNPVRDLSTLSSLISYPLSAPANIDRYRGYEGTRAEGAVAVRRACLSSWRRRLCREGEESGTSEVRSRTNVYQPAYPSLRKLEGVIAKLEPLSDRHALVQFLRNVDNVKTLASFVQELTNAITDYQVCAPSPTVIFNEHLVRFRYYKGCMRGQGASTANQGTSVMIRRTSVVIRRTSLTTQGISWWGSSLPRYDLR